ncbi:C2 domain-containing protein [Heterostelium album PN500]|uniref:C2 domain-containing protein n=1 Tax=Heterostelium pallidum (strain ATCC 26659 / Pp 5 / PN500) TaxID=670386 RepID=D3B9A7_HETP5|nr:C2 domain-containing protein [Heterostelium album PN500]EFA81819.1 C2 domain-containing protein [Heterostelium album PN500]|eukprot:XP_020433936.1 C2 domain-containing protein [Heterostelium album PN500]
MTKSYHPKSNDDLVLYRLVIFNGKVDKPTDSNGLSDPYVKVFAVRNNCKDNESKELIFKTAVCKKTLTPVWNVENYFVISYTDKIEAISVELWDQDLLRDEFIGAAKNYIGENYIFKSEPFTKPIDEYKMFAVENTMYDSKSNGKGIVNISTYILERNAENLAKAVNYKQ